MTYKDTETKYSGSVSIPSEVTVEGTKYSVTAIGRYAFKECVDLTMVSLPNSLTVIDQYAFQSCTGLTSIEIPNSVTTINDYAFQGCSGLTSLDIPNSVTSIGNNAFEECTGIASVTIPTSVTSLGDLAFHGCKSLKSIDIPSSITSIAAGVFMDCSELESVTFPSSLTSIGYASFQYCEKLASVVFPQSLETIGNQAFKMCTSLTSVTIPESVTKVGFRAFEMCLNLNTMNVEEGNSVYDSRGNCNAIIETATNKLVQGCYASVIPNTVTSIGSEAFSHCYNLTKIIIPNSVKTIEDNSFYDCNRVTYATVGDGVTEIGENAFAFCRKMTSITLGKGLKDIKSGAFANSGLKTIEIAAVVPPKCESNTFDGVDKSGCEVYVPVGSLIDYKEADQWSDFYYILSDEDFVPVISIALNEQEVSLEYNGEVQLSATLLPENATVKTIVWRSSNESVAKVSEDGKVTAVRAGIAYITASANDGSGVSESCKITVVGGAIDTDNYFTVANLSVLPGATVRIPIRLTNKSEIAAFSCKITLPEGITLAKDENGYMADVTYRSPSTATGHSHSLAMNVLDDGTIVLAALSVEGKSFIGNDGDLFYITVNVSNEIEGGDYAIRISDIVLASSSLAESYPAEVSATISVADYMLGDANDDRVVTITDAVAIINYIVGKPAGTFNAKAADVDGNGIISITDAVAVVYMVNNIEVNPSSQNAAVDVVEIKDVEISAGETKVIDIAVNGDYDITAMQMDLTLSQGLSVKNVSLGNGATASHRLFENKFDDGSHRIALLSMSSDAIKDNNESVLRVEIEADETFEGDGTIAVSNIIATTTEVVEMPVVEAAAKAIGTSGIDEISNDASDETERYDLAGRKICNPTIGINIVKFSDGTVRKEIVK